MGSRRTRRQQLRKGASYNLYHAAELGDVERINGLLTNLGGRERYRVLRSEDVETGKLPLHFAAQGGHLDALELLFSQMMYDGVPEDPANLPDLVNTRTRKGGWSALHLAAARGHIKVVQWLVTSHGADLSLEDNEGNTPLHRAVPPGHREVVRYLVTEGASLYTLNNDKMMPVSFCQDSPMFDALFSSYIIGSPSLETQSSSMDQVSLIPDIDKRTILHYAAQFANSNAEVMAKLIAETADPEQIYERDNRGDSFLHVAAKAGNMAVLQALKTDGGPGHIDVARLLRGGGHDRVYSPGMYALLYNHREFFDELITMGKVEITLSSIIKALLAELFDKPDIQPRLALFASTLPTYLALYANKDCIFDFLLETKLLTLSQWDDEHNRTCLQWAVLDKRTDIVEKLCRHVQVRPGIQDAYGKTALQHAFEQNNHMLVETLRARRIFKEHEEKLERDREVYVHALNAILVSAALIASVTFAGWLQLPYDAEFHTSSLKVFWASNSISFFTAVAVMCVTTAALVPTPAKYVEDIVNQLRVAIVLDSGLLAVSLAAVTWAFAAAGFAALYHAHIFAYQEIMRGTVAVGGLLCVIVWLSFVLQFIKRAPPKSVFLALVLPSLPRMFSEMPWWPASLWNKLGRIEDSVRFGYPIKSRSELNAIMDIDLVAHRASQFTLENQASPTSSPMSLEKMQQVLGKVEIQGMSSFITDIYQRRQDEMAHKGQKEAIMSRIHHFDT